MWHIAPTCGYFLLYGDFIQYNMRKVKYKKTNNFSICCDSVVKYKETTDKSIGLFQIEKYCSGCKNGIMPDFEYSDIIHETISEDGSVIKKKISYDKLPIM